MRIITFLIFIYLFSVRATPVLAHKGHSHPTHELPVWKLKDNTAVSGSFLFSRNDSIYLEKADHNVTAFAFHEFNDQSQKLLESKISRIHTLNQKNSAHPSPSNNVSLNKLLWFFAGASFLLMLLVVFLSIRLKFGLKILTLCAVTGIFLSFSGGHLYQMMFTDPDEIDRAFEPFKPAINTFWDENYFYVESRGIPDHEMMTGIVKWQQQVPIPQCYIGSNAWPIPLKPEIATTPVPVNQEHFLRGAVAVAANGVPIFNPYTNTGLDALVDGQLDQYGGHSGRADDYHYHIAPLHLDTITSDVLPIAYALDGFAIYGPLEPDGSPMKPLDENHGHFGTNGVYHYHGTKGKPYMIGRMVGKVTEDNTLQIVPQAVAKGVRPALTPLSGAVITDCTPYPGGNGYKLTYVRNNQIYIVDYSWTAAGKYTYNFIGPTGTMTSVYNGFIPCSITTATENFMKKSVSLKILPNPVSMECTVEASDPDIWSGIQKLVLYDQRGNIVLTKESEFSRFSVGTFPKGIYFVRFFFEDARITKKIIVQ